ncbi:MAG: hydroxyacid dehydrogenase [Proteobacteria bacterium]|nr:hydroxyacid dehydrogenase [Pseudomonadota bacterium]
MATNKKQVLASTTMAQAGWDFIAKRDDVEARPYKAGTPTPDFHAMLRELDGIALGGPSPFGAAELAAAPRLKVVTRLGVGYDAVDVPALTARRIPLMVVGTANSVSVAEQTFYLMMTVAKRGRRLHELVVTGRWGDKAADRPAEFFAKTLLIVGFGRIGTRVAKRGLGMEMSVLVYDPYVAADTIRAAGCEPVADLDAALPRADFITIHCPKNRETVGMFGAARLARLKPSAYLVNAARGGLVEEAALYQALRSGKLAGAGLDVFEQEPTPTDNPLLTLPNLVASPHMAAGTVESAERAAVAAMRNILSVLDGSPIRENVVNPEVFNS